MNGNFSLVRVKGFQYAFKLDKIHLAFDYYVLRNFLFELLHPPKYLRLPLPFPFWHLSFQRQLTTL
jgi:hypothetical protein